jgi:soluble lytic murein transglycosylase-like protein
MRIFVWIAAVSTALGLCSIARADIYAFVDDQGVTHFSNVPTDEHYQLVLASPPAADETGDDAQVRVNPKLLARADQYDTFIQEAARVADVDSQLLRAVIVVESAFDERAVSKRGARGLMQLMPATGRRYGARDLFNPLQNIRAGARYLRDLLDRYGDDLELVLAAYNAGEDAVDRYGRVVPPFKETRAYVPRVLSVYSTLQRLAQST